MMEFSSIIMLRIARYSHCYIAPIVVIFPPNLKMKARPPSKQLSLCAIYETVNEFFKYPNVNKHCWRNILLSSFLWRTCSIRSSTNDTNGMRMSVRSQTEMIYTCKQFFNRVFFFKFQHKIRLAKCKFLLNITFYLTLKTNRQILSFWKDLGSGDNMARQLEKEEYFCCNCFLL